MKRILLLIGLLLACGITLKSARLACTGSSPIWTAGDVNDIASCHTSASDGDTIYVSAGGTVSTAISITKYVKIICTANPCSVTDNTPDGGSLFAIAESTAGSTLIFGFDVTQGTGIHGSTGVISFGLTSGGKPILATQNSLTINTAGGGGSFFVVQTNRGVIWNNIMTATPGGSGCNNNASFLRHKNASGALDSSWTTVSKFGSADTDGDQNLYVEGNLITLVSDAVDLDDNGRQVFRFNTMDRSTWKSHGRDSSPSGARSAEIYNNTWIYSTEDECGAGIPANPVGAIFSRSHTGPIFNNVLPDINGSPSWTDVAEIGVSLYRLSNSADSCWTGGYPLPHQFGWGWTNGSTGPIEGFMQDPEPAYIFNNTGTGNLTLVRGEAVFPDTCPTSDPQTTADAVVENQDYYQYGGTPQSGVGTPFTGSPGANNGVGVGTIARIPTTCTTGVAYWATDEGEWDSTHAGVDGKMYICTATNTWEARYATAAGSTTGLPYPYPNPLTLGNSPVAGRLMVR